MEQRANYPFLKFIKDVWGFIKPYKYKFWAGVLLRFFSDIVHLYPVFAVSQTVLILSKNLPPDEAVRQLLPVLILWGLISIYLGFGENLAKYLGYQIAENAGLDLYKKALSHVYRLDLSWQEIENSGNKMKRIDRGRDGVNELVRKIFDVLISVIVNIGGVLLVFTTLEKFISFFILLFIVSFFLIGTFMLRRAIAQEEVVNKKNEDLGGITFESLNNIHTIKSLSIEKSISRSVSEKSNILVDEIRKRIALFRKQAGFLESYYHFSEFIMAAYIAWGVINGRYEISLLVLFIGLFTRVGESANELINVTQEIVISKIWINRAMQVLDTKPVIENEQKSSTQLPYPKDWKKLKIENINFGYKKEDALKNISLTINRSESIGIVGLSGAGKSTLFKLLLDLYEDYDGDIFLDNVSFKKMNRQSYIDHTAVVLQDTELFNLSLKDNITLAGVDSKSNSITVDEAIHMAHLDDVVSSLTNGVDTLVGEKGVKLSGGQRQRVGIARALYRQPDILLLDEATSHLDGHSERQIREALAENLHKFTTIIIAHRLSTIKEVDKIVVLEKGKVVESGTFDELLAKNGSFAKMWKEQKL